MHMHSFTAVCLESLSLPFITHQRMCLLVLVSLTCPALLSPLHNYSPCRNANSLALEWGELPSLLLGLLLLPETLSELLRPPELVEAMGKIDAIAAKSALLGLTKAWALELAPWNICVNAVAPGSVHTQMVIERDGSIRSSSIERAQVRNQAKLVTSQSYSIPMAMNLDLRDAGYQLLKNASLNSASGVTVEWYRESPEMTATGNPEKHAGVAFVSDFSEEIQSGSVAKVSFTPLPLTDMQYANKPSGIQQVMTFGP